MDHVAGASTETPSGSKFLLPVHQVGRISSCVEEWRNITENAFILRIVKEG